MVTVEEMREHAPGPWKWRVDDPADLPPGVEQFISDKVADS